MPSKAKLLSFRPFEEVHSLELSENITVSGVPEIGCSLSWNPMTDWLGSYFGAQGLLQVFICQTQLTRQISTSVSESTQGP